MKYVIEARNISKKYLLMHQSMNPYSTLVETLSNKAKQMVSHLKHGFKKSNQERGSQPEVFWALNNINFDIEKGDRVGIIGRNGAGKSTLLKILARISQPTTGHIKIRGRVSSLLEVGTGFHPELSGRENIFLNGAILGMTHQEIKKKFDEIVAFAEVEKFLDTPVKRFSSGMYMRLGFAIAANLDPDVLIVDEVLSVGDSRFQERCVKKLDDLSQHGRTVIFVSHDMNSVSRLCNKGIYLNNGQIQLMGPMEQCITAYMQGAAKHSRAWVGDKGDENIRFYKIALKGEQEDREFFYQDEIVEVEIEYEVLKPADDLIFGIGVWRQHGQLLARSHTSDHLESTLLFTKAGRRKIVFPINALQFYEGDYLLKPECQLHHKKNILNDEIVLKFSIYPPRSYSRFIHVPGTEGVALGNHWKHCESKK